jgi:hypothetical protein
LKVRTEEVPLKPLLKGKFLAKEEIPMAHEVKHLSTNESPGRGGKKDGNIAASNSPSAAAIAKVLSGMDFPKNKAKVIEHAERNTTKLHQPEQVIGTLKEIPDRTYHNMADVEKAIGDIR